MEQPINNVLRHGVSVVADSLFASSNDNNSDDISEPTVDDVVSDNEDNTDELVKSMSEPSQLTTENNNTISLQFTKEHETKIQEHDDAIQKLSQTSSSLKLDKEPPLPEVPVAQSLGSNTTTSQESVFTGDFAKFM